MRTVYIQAQYGNGSPIDVDCFTANEAFKYENWWNNSPVYDVRLKHIELKHAFDKNTIAVGSVEYVEKFLGQRRKPLNVPNELLELSGPYKVSRDVLANAVNYIGWFIKSDTHIKSGVETGMLRSVSQIDEKLGEGYALFFREEIDFVSEWRAFIYNGVIADIRLYLGTPNVDLRVLYNYVKTLMSEWESMPKACTIDVGFDSNMNPVLVECHEFYSCGLYGFENYKLLTKMYASFFDAISKEVEG